MESNWYEHFFQGVALDVWRKAMSPVQTLAEVDFLEKTLEPVPGAPLLDVACGNGRHSVELAARGYLTTGVDIAEEFIREAQRRAAESGLHAEFLQGDMRRLPWQSEFDGAFCFGNSFGYLEHRGHHGIPERAFPNAQARGKLCVGYRHGRRVNSAQAAGAGLGAAR